MYAAVIAFMVVCVCGQDMTQELTEPVDELANTDLVLAFVVGRQFRWEGNVHPTVHSP